MSAKILLADGDAAWRQLLQAALQAKGHEVQPAASAMEALQHTRRIPFDLLLTEMKMPGASGTDLLRFMQLEKPETSVAMISAEAAVPMVVEAMQLGAIDYMVKPLAVEEVVRRVEAALGRRTLLLDTRHYQVYLERTFRRYISPEVLTVLMSTREIDELQARQLEASVMFVDVRDFTALTKNTDPQVLLPQLNTYYFQPATDIISAHKGTVDKFIGDGIMAVFGAPLAVEDHAKLALKAALDLERELEATRLGGKHPFRVGIGLASGLVISGNLGGTKRLDFTVFGPVVNLAARLEKLAAAGEVLLDEATYRLVSPLTIPVRQEHAQVKGEGADLNIYKLSSLRPATSGPAS